MSNALALEDCTALVTGGAQGIGEAIVRALAAAGARVAIVDRQGDRARALADGLGGKVVAVAADIASVKGCQTAVAEVRRKLGAVSLLVNNAAPARDRSMIGRIGDADWEDHLGVVGRAAVALADGALADLSSSGHGAIVNVSSILAKSVAMDQGSMPYHVSKAALEQLTRWLAVHCGPAGVRVNAVAPGLIDRDWGTKLTDNAANRKIVESVVPLQRAGHGREVAEAVVFLASRAASYITGQVLVVDGGLSVQEVFGASLRSFNVGRDFKGD